jgi:hypothetical protein
MSLSENSTSLTVADNSLATTIHIPTPRRAIDRDRHGFALGRTVLLSDGVTPVTAGEGLTMAQLGGLEFKPTASAQARTRPRHIRCRIRWVRTPTGEGVRCLLRIPRQQRFECAAPVVIVNLNHIATGATRFGDLGRSVMKTVVLFNVVALVVMRVAVAYAAPGNGCSQVVQKINNITATIDQNATAYWTHRANFVDLIYGPSSQVVPNAMQLAQQEKAQADPLKAGMPNNVASLKGLITAAQAQNCLSPTQLLAIAEPPIKHGKRVNFDQFPSEIPGEEESAPTVPRMPRN